MVLCMTVNPGWGGQAFLETLAEQAPAPARADRPRRRRSRWTAGSTPRPPRAAPQPAPRCSSPVPPSSARDDPVAAVKAISAPSTGRNPHSRVVRPAVCERVRTVTRIEPVDCTVLIVDDHPSFRASARVLLESEGFNVIGEAVDGASAVEETCRLQAPARAAGRAAPRHRRLRRRGPHHRPPGLAGGDPRLQPRLLGLRSALSAAPARAASSRRPSSRASASRSCWFEHTDPRAGDAGARGPLGRAARRGRRPRAPITSTIAG